MLLCKSYFGFNCATRLVHIHGSSVCVCVYLANGWFYRNVLFSDGRPAVDEQAESVSTSSTVDKPGYNAEGKMVFSKFDFSNSSHGDTHTIPHNYALKKLTNVKGLKGYKNQLEYIEGKQRKLEELKVSYPYYLSPHNISHRISYVWIYFSLNPLISIMCPVM